MHPPIRDRVAMCIMHLAAIIDAVVYFVTLTTCNSDLRGKWVFSDVCDRLTGKD